MTLLLPGHPDPCRVDGCQRGWIVELFCWKWRGACDLLLKETEKSGALKNQETWLPSLFDLGALFAAAKLSQPKQKQVYEHVRSKPYCKGPSILERYTIDIYIWMFPKNGGTPKWMVIMENPIRIGWFGGYHYFWKHPYINSLDFMVNVTLTVWLYQASLLTICFSPGRTRWSLHFTLSWRAEVGDKGNTMGKSTCNL